MQGIDFIQDFAIILLVAGGLGWASQRLGLSVFVGYLVAGILVGPFTEPFKPVDHLPRIQTLAQVGLVFVMFSVGLRLSLRRLRRLGVSVILGVLVSSAIVYYLTRVLGIAMGWSSRECLFFAAILMISSSAIVGKLLQDAGRTHDRAGQLALGVTMIEDVIAVVMLALLSSILRLEGSSWPALGQTLGALGAFVSVAVIGGLLLIPALLRRIAQSAGEELHTVVIAALLFILAALAYQAGFSLALGAFLLGAIIGETQHRAHIERVFEGLRDVFMAVFFVAIGMQMQPALLAGSVWLVVALAAFTIVARVAAVTLGLSLVGTSTRDALRAGLSVGVIGEFSFIFAQLDGTGQRVPHNFFSLAVGVSVLTALSAPLLTRHSATISDRLLRLRPGWLQVLQSQYHGWIDSLRARRRRSKIWQLSRKRILQISVEMLFVTGLLVFSEPLRDSVQDWLGRNWLFPNGPAVLFWVAMTLVVLAPIVAIWRNMSALCLIFAQFVTSGNSRALRLRPVTEMVFKAVAGVSLYIWLATIAPMTGGGRWVLVASIVAALVGLALFKRRLVYWHSELEFGLQDMLDPERYHSADTPAPWLRPDAGWDMFVSEVVVPDLADCQGRKLAELQLRSRFGCTVVGLGRQGHLIPLPTPDTVLYPRDKVLLIGTTEQVDAGRKVLTTVSAAGLVQADFEDVRMEIVSMPPRSPASGRDLKTMVPPQTFRIQIAGINRGGLRILNPAGNEVIHAGDQLLVLGPPDQIRAFEESLAENDEAG